MLEERDPGETTDNPFEDLAGEDISEDRIRSSAGESQVREESHEYDLPEEPGRSAPKPEIGLPPEDEGKTVRVSKSRTAKPVEPRAAIRESGKRIGILGLGSSGKTVFLSMLYHISAERSEFGAGDWFIDWHSNDGGATVKYLRELSNKILGLTPSSRVSYKDDELQTKVDRRFPDGTNITSHLSFRMIRQVGMLDVPLDISTQDVKGELLQEAVGSFDSLSPGNRRAFDEIVDFCSQSRTLIIFHNALQRDVVHDRGSLMTLISRVLERKKAPKALAFAVTGTDIFPSQQEAEDYRSQIEEKYAGIFSLLEQAKVHYRIFMLSSIGRNMTRKKDSAELPPKCMGAEHICPDCQELSDEPGREPKPEGFEELFDYVFKQVSPVYARVPLFATITALFRKLAATFFGRWYSLLIWLLLAAAGFGIWLQLEDRMAESIESLPPVESVDEARIAVRQARNYTDWFRDGKCSQAGSILSDWRKFSALIDTELNDAGIGELRLRVSGIAVFVESSKSRLFDDWAKDLRKDLGFRADLMELEGKADRDKLVYIGGLLEKWNGSDVGKQIEEQALKLLSRRKEFWSGEAKKLGNAETEKDYIHFFDRLRAEQGMVLGWQLHGKQEYLEGYAAVLEQAETRMDKQGRAMIDAAYQRKLQKAFLTLAASEFEEAASIAERVVDDYPEKNNGDLADLIKFCGNMSKAAESLQNGENGIAIQVLKDELSAERVPNCDGLITSFSESWVDKLESDYNRVLEADRDNIVKFFPQKLKELSKSQATVSAEFEGLDMLGRHSDLLKEIEWLSASTGNLAAREAVEENRASILDLIEEGEHAQAAALTQRTLQHYESYCDRDFGSLSAAIGLLTDAQSRLENRNWAGAIELIKQIPPLTEEEIVRDAISDIRGAAYEEWADDLLEYHAHTLEENNALLLEYAADDFQNIESLRDECTHLKGDELVSMLKDAKADLRTAVSRSEARMAYGNLPQIPSRADRCDHDELLKTKQEYQRFLDDPENGFMADGVLSNIFAIDRMIDEQERWQRIDGIFTSQMTRSDRKTLMRHCRDFIGDYPDSSISGNINRIIYNLQNWNLTIARFRVVSLPSKYRKLESINVKVRSVPPGGKDGGKLLADKTFKIKNGKIGGIFEDTEIEARWDSDRDLLIFFEFMNECGIKNELRKWLAIRDYRNRIDKKYNKSIKYVDGIKTEIEIEMDN